jgi:hypothetical protein
MSVFGLIGWIVCCVAWCWAGYQHGRLAELKVWEDKFEELSSKVDSANAGETPR